MNIDERLVKAESLDKDTRDKFLFDYLKLKALAEQNNADKWRAIAEIVNIVYLVSSINKDNLSKFIDDFENAYEKNKVFNVDILVQLICYAVDASKIEKMVSK